MATGPPYGCQPS
ncbi:hypothetical protein ECEC4203_1184, partial [Escherichia coli EC4203]